MNDFKFPHGVTVVRPGEKPHLREEFQRLRYQEFTERLKYEPVNETGLEVDMYDPYATYVVIIVRGAILAGCRLIDGECVPITLDRSLVRPGRHFEISRMLCSSQVTEGRIAILCSLYAEMVRYAFVTCGYEHLYCDTRQVFLRSLQGLLGDTIVPIGAPAEHEKNGQLLTLVPTMIVASDLDVIIGRLAQRVAPQLAAA